MGRVPKRPTYSAGGTYGLLFDVSQLANGKDWLRNFLMARDCYDDCIASLDDQLGRLLDAMRSQGLLDNTLVVITADHGESFSDHGVFGHGNALYLDQTSVPLVILSPEAPAGATVTNPVSLRDLPATIVDQLRLADGSPFPGHSLAAFWSVSPGQAAPKTTSAFSEMKLEMARPPQPEVKPVRKGAQMSLVASGWHYIRDGVGPEQLYDLKRDPSELQNVVASAEVFPVLEIFRQRLLEVLTDDLGSTEVEEAYLARYRRLLKSEVQASSAPPGTLSAVDSH